MTAAELLKVDIDGKRILATLRSTLANAIAAVQGTNSWLAAGGVKEANLTALRMQGDSINRLETAFTQRVLKADPGYSWSRWVAAANEIGAVINSYAKDAEGFSSWAIVTSTLTATATQIQEGAAAAVSAATPALGFVAAGLAAVAVIVVMK